MEIGISREKKAVTFPIEKWTNKKIGILWDCELIMVSLPWINQFSR